MTRESGTHDYRGSSPSRKLARRIPCSLGCSKLFATVEAASMHERSFHQKALRRLEVALKEKEKAE